MSLFKHFLRSHSRKPHFVTTAEMVVCIEKILKEAEQEIIIVSPYIKMSKRIFSIINDKIRNNVDIKIVYREKFETNKLNITTFKRENLHAKCFFSDKAILVGSMNLYDYSQINNDEMGIFFTKDECPQLYEKIKNEVYKLCNSFPDVQDSKIDCSIGTHNYEISKGYTRNKQDGESTNDSESTTLPLEIDKEYELEALNKYFSFINDYHSGIKETKRGNIVLFYYSKSKYNNKEQDGIIYYIGQNTASKKQILKYGNKILYDNFLTGKGRIFLFKDSIFKGEFIISEQPFQNEIGQWVFPLKPKSRV